MNRVLEETAQKKLHAKQPTVSLLQGYPLGLPNDFPRIWFNLAFRLHLNCRLHAVKAGPENRLTDGNGMTFLSVFRGLVGQKQRGGQ